MRCPSCQAEMHYDDKTCKYCGTSIDQSEAETPAKPYVPSITHRPSSAVPGTPAGKRPFSCCFGFFIFLSIAAIILGLNAYTFLKSEELPSMITEVVSGFKPTGFLWSIDNDFTISRDLTVGDYILNDSNSSFTVRRGVTYYNSLSSFHEMELKRKYNILNSWDSEDMVIDEVLLSADFEIEDYTYYKLKYRIDSEIQREEVVAARTAPGGKIEFIHISAVNDVITEDIIEMYLISAED